MDKKIYFKGKLNDLLFVLKKCQPERGYTAAHFIKTMCVYFERFYTVEVGHTDTPAGQLIDRNKCFIHVSRSTVITVGEVIDELIKSGHAVRESQPPGRGGRFLYKIKSDK